MKEIKVIQDGMSVVHSSTSTRMRIPYWHFTFDRSDHNFLVKPFLILSFFRLDSFLKLRYLWIVLPSKTEAWLSAQWLVRGCRLQSLALDIWKKTKRIIDCEVSGIWNVFPYLRVVSFLLQMFLKPLHTVNCLQLSHFARYLSK